MSVTPQGTTQPPTEDVEIFSKYLYKNANFWQSLHAPAQVNLTQKPAINNQNPITSVSELQNYLTGEGKGKFKTGNNSIYGQPNYSPDNTILTKLREWYFQQENTDNTIHGQYGKPTYNSVDYHLGKYSPIFLSPYRTNTQFPTAYTDVTYNPNTDKGLGNKVWIQSVTKKLLI